MLKIFEDCEYVFGMVNDEIDKVNKVVCGVKVKVVELDGCFYQVEVEFQCEKFWVVELEREFIIY